MLPAIYFILFRTHHYCIGTPLHFMRGAMSGLEIPGLVVGVVGIIPVCLQFNDYVRRLARDIRHSSDQRTYKQAEIVYHLQVIELQKPAFERLDERQQNVLAFKIIQLEDSLSELEGALKELNKEPPRIIGPAIWAFRAKKKVQGLLDRISKERNDLAQQLILIGSYFHHPDKEIPSDTERILHFIADSVARRDKTAESTVSREVPQQDVDSSDLSPIAGSELQYKLSPTRLSFLIVEEISVVGVHDRDRTVARVNEVANVFHGERLEDRAFQTQTANIAQCLGYAVRPQSVQLVCEAPLRSTSSSSPEGGPPRLTSLRELLLRRKNHSLNARLSLARSLAKAVFYTHAYRYVHKDLRPANILLETGGGSRPDGDDGEALGRALLAGFGDARAEDGSSLRKGGPASLDDVNLYQHPSRVGGGPTGVEAYTFLHDVYSLGVCLLEVGLWTSFLGDKHAGMRGAPPAERQRRLNGLAERHLPKEMGDIYAQVVRKCLRGCDLGGFGEVGGAMKRNGGDDDVALGSRYCEEVLEGLGSVHI